MSDIALTGSDIHSFGMSDIFASQMFRKGFALDYTERKHNKTLQSLP